MPQAPNFIKVRSSSSLKKQNIESERNTLGAGSNDPDNFPGSNGQHSPVRNKDGVSQPQSYENADSRSEVYSQRIGEMGDGAVGSPSELGPGPLIRGYDVLFYPYDEGIVHRSKKQDVIEATSVRFEIGSVETSPGGSFQAGSMTKELERTTGRDGDREKRTIERHRRILEKDNFR